MGFRPEIHISASQLRREQAASIGQLMRKQYPVFVRNLKGRPLCEMLSAEHMDLLCVACFDCREALKLLNAPKDISIRRLQGYAHHFFSERGSLSERALYRVLDLDNNCLFYLLPASLKEQLEKLLGYDELTSINNYSSGNVHYLTFPPK